jgi:hypothetical protein
MLEKDIGPLDIQEHTIPRLHVHTFYYKTEIDPNGYNAPSNPMFASLDSFYSNHGEIYQVTSAEHHPIKTENLSVVRPYFADYLSRNDKVEFILSLSKFSKPSQSKHSIIPSTRKRTTRKPRGKAKKVRGLRHLQRPKLGLPRPRKRNLQKTRLLFLIPSGLSNKSWRWISRSPREA